MPERPENLFAEENASMESEEQGESLEQKESESLKERLGLIVRTVSEKPDLEVTTEVDAQMYMQMAMQGMDANQEWYLTIKVDPKTREVIKEFVHIPNEILENETEAKGKAAHEAGHVAITRWSFIPDKIMQETGFHSLMASTEERPTDQVVRERYAGAGVWVDSARKGSIAEGNARKEELLKKHGAEESALVKIPRFQQLGSLIVYEPHYEEIPKDFDPEVIETYEKIREHIEAIEHTLPEEGSHEKEAVNKAKERYKILYKEVWPHVKKLVQEDTEDEALKQMQQKKSGVGPGEGEGEEEKQEGEEESVGETNAKDARDALMKAFKALPQEVQEELIKEAMKIIQEIEDKMVEELEGKLVDGADTHKESKAK